jgi:hypothetical protein
MFGYGDRRVRGVLDAVSEARFAFGVSGTGGGLADEDELFVAKVEELSGRVSAGGSMIKINGCELDAGMERSGD